MTPYSTGPRDSTPAAPAHDTNTATRIAAPSDSFSRARAIRAWVASDAPRALLLAIGSLARVARVDGDVQEDEGVELEGVASDALAAIEDGRRALGLVRLARALELSSRMVARFERSMHAPNARDPGSTAQVRAPDTRARAAKGDVAREAFGSGPLPPPRVSS